MMKKAGWKSDNYGAEIPIKDRNDTILPTANSDFKVSHNRKFTQRKTKIELMEYLIKTYKRT
jgi:hypothetical protein